MLRTLFLPLALCSLFSAGLFAQINGDNIFNASVQDEINTAFAGPGLVAATEGLSTVRFGGDEGAIPLRSAGPAADLAATDARAGELRVSIPLGDVVINEFVADNDSTSMVSDPDGGYPDWIEFYNNTNATIDLSGAYLSDKADNLLKWEFPAGTTIPAEGYLIVWADEDGDQQGIHANFKLDKDGEAIYLSNAGDSTRIDEVVFGVQQTNVSMSRVPNGTGDFRTQHTTHGFSNDTPVANRNPAGEIELQVTPNPAGDFLNVRFPGAAAGAMRVDLYAVSGRNVFTGREANNGTLELDLVDLTPGFYLLRVRDAVGKLGTVKFAKR